MSDCPGAEVMGSNGIIRLIDAPKDARFFLIQPGGSVQGCWWLTATITRADFAFLRTRGKILPAQEGSGTGAVTHARLCDLGLDMSNLPGAGPRRRIPIGNTIARWFGFEAACLEPDFAERYSPRTGASVMDALPLYRQILSSVRSNTPESVRILLETGEELIRQVRYREAKVPLRRAVKTAEKLSPAAPLTIECKARLANLLIDLREKKKAALLAEETFLYTDGGTDTAEFFDALVSFGSVLVRLLYANEAVHVLTRAVAINERLGRLRESVTATAYRDLATAILMHGKPKTALAFYKHAARLRENNSSFAEAVDDVETLKFEQMINAESPIDDSIRVNPLELQARILRVLPAKEQYEATRVLCNKYAWGVPTDAALTALASLGKIVEVGAGTGYWTALLRARGADVVAYDMAPVDLGNNKYHTRTRSWTEVHKAGAKIAGKHADRALFICWPEEVVAMRAMKAYRGDKLACVGVYGVLTDSPDLFEELSLNWSVENVIELPGWTVGLEEGQQDCLYILKREAKQRSAAHSLN
jgi:tetratricopeptide (TPR) repeat protein